LIPVVEGQNHWNDKQRVIQTHPPGTVSDAERGLADQARDAASLHGTQDVASPFRENASRIEVPLVAKGGEHRFLTAHRRLDGARVEHITLKDRQSRMDDLKL